MPVLTKYHAESAALIAAWDEFCFNVLDYDTPVGDIFTLRLRAVMARLWSRSPYIRMIVMARKKTTAATGKTVWINRKLDSDELREYDAWDLSDTEAFARLTELVAEGYSLQVRHDSFSSAIQVTLYENGVQQGNNPMGMSSRSPDMWDAIRMTIYKHDVIFKGAWVPPTERPNSIRG